MSRSVQGALNPDLQQPSEIDSLATLAAIGLLQHMPAMAAAIYTAK